MRHDQARTHTFSGTDVWDLVRIRAHCSADQVAFVWHPHYGGSPREWTYRELAAVAAGLAAGLQRRGIGQGDRVLIHLENCPEFVISWYACAAIGAVAVTTNTRSVADEMGYFCADSQPAFAITQPRFAEMIAACAPRLRLAVLDSRGDESFASLAADPGEFTPRPPDPIAPMSVQYTSGTTSRPKGVLWTHANALWGARVNALHEDLHPDDRHLTYLPLFTRTRSATRCSPACGSARGSFWYRNGRPAGSGMSPCNTAAPGSPSWACRTAPWRRAQPGRYRPATATGYSAPACATPPSTRRTVSRRSAGGA